MILIQYFGYRILVHADSTHHDSLQLVERLRFDFFDFKENVTSDQIDLEIKITRSLQKPKIRLPILKTRNLLRYWLWGSNYFYQSNRSTSMHLEIFKAKKLSVSFSDAENAHELIFLFILSSIGEHMERLGWVRIHAAGFCIGPDSFVVPLPSNSGKSSFVQWLIDNTEVTFLGDETVFTDGKIVAGFPIRRALRKNSSREASKILRNWPDLRIQSSCSLAQVSLFRDKFSKLSFFWEFFWGLGNAQMIEFFLRKNSLWLLIRISINRVKIFFRILPKIQNYPNWSKIPLVNYSQMMNFSSENHFYKNPENEAAQLKLQ